MRLLFDPESEAGIPEGEDAGLISLDTPIDEVPTSEELNASEAQPESESVESANTQEIKSWKSVRDAAREMGYEVGDTDDDQKFLQQVLRDASRGRQEDLYAQLGRKLAPKAEEIESYLKKQAKPAEEAPSYLPPEYDKRWLAMVERHPDTGVIIGKPGVDPRIVDAVQKRIDWEEKFRENPFELINKGIEDQVSKRVQQQIDAVFAQRERESAQKRIIEENSSWLYQHGPDGQMTRDFNGNVQFSPAGAMYYKHMQDLQKRGITDLNYAHDLAYNLTGAYFASQKAKSESIKQDRTESVQTKQAKSGKNRGASLAKPITERTEDGESYSPPRHGGNSLRALLMQGFDNESWSDDEISRQVVGG